MAKRVLIIDDEFEEIKDLFEVIEANGHSYEGVNNITDALKKLETQYYSTQINCPAFAHLK